MLFCFSTLKYLVRAHVCALVLNALRILHRVEKNWPLPWWRKISPPLSPFFPLFVCLVGRQEPHILKNKGIAEWLGVLSHPNVWCSFYIWVPCPMVNPWELSSKGADNPCASGLFFSVYWGLLPHYLGLSRAQPSWLVKKKKERF